ASISREFAPIAARARATVIDKSSVWRMDPDVPLVVPEVNADALRRRPKNIVATPNCSTTQMVVALKPLHDVAKIRRVVVSTYQASSGNGAKALRELDVQVEALGRGQPVPPPSVHAARLAGNVLPHDWKIGPDGYSEEESKMIAETQKIFGDPSLRGAGRGGRGRVRAGPSEWVTLEFEGPLTVGRARAAWSRARGVVGVDDAVNRRFPLPLDAAGRDEVFVGRLRI